MKHFRLFALLLCAMLVTGLKAQVINGDLNHNDNLDVEDVTLLIDGYLTGEKELVGGSMADPYDEDNSRIVGKWYLSKVDSVTFSEDGYFIGNGLIDGNVYKFLPLQGRIVLFDYDENVVNEILVTYMKDDYMVVRGMQGGYQKWVRTKPTQPVEEIQLNKTHLDMVIFDECQLGIRVTPSYADNTEVIWTSSDSTVATVSSKGYVVAVKAGDVVIKATAADGSGVSATCSVHIVTGYEVSGYYFGYGYVDLGLSVYWATKNINAASLEDNGDYFAWGETTPKSDYSWGTYKYKSGSYFTKYITSRVHGTIDDKTQLDTEDDAAHAQWGGNWRMPTKEEMDELITNCDFRWIETGEWPNNRGGIRITGPGPERKSIFLPAGGQLDGTYSPTYWSGLYWTSTLYSSWDEQAYSLYFRQYGADEETGIMPKPNKNDKRDRYYGFLIRAVCPK